MCSYGIWGEGGPSRTLCQWTNPPTHAHQYRPVVLRAMPMSCCVHYEPFLRIISSLHILREERLPRDFKDNILSLYIKKCGRVLQAFPKSRGRNFKA